jgi:hypothetical protein
MRYFLLITGSIGFAATGAEHDPVDVLTRATAKVLASAKSIPNYTCVETVRRDYFEPAAATIPRACSVLLEQRRHPTLDMALWLYSTDRLRLDVTMATGREIYSWLGANHFDDAGIDHVVRSGPFSTGSFAGYLTAVFEEEDVRQFIFNGTKVVDNRILMEYSFQVAQAHSHYSVKLHDSWVIVAYGGTLEVDPRTADVVRMTIVTENVPSATGVCQTSTVMDLAWIQLSKGHFLLPKSSSQRFVYPNVEETENATVFSNCREFRGESTINFGDQPVTDDVANNSSAKALFLPGGLPLSFALTTPIQTDTAAAGDSFSARLVGALRDEKGKILAPKGTEVEGHLTLVQSYFKPPEVQVMLRPETLRIRGARVALRAMRDWRRVMLETKKAGKKTLEIVLPPQGEDFDGVFRFQGMHIVVPDGFRSDWRTVAAGGTQVGALH